MSVPMLWWAASALSWLSWLSLARLPVLELALLVLAARPIRAVLNITLADTASQISYSPPACGLTLSSAGTETCNSSWRIVTSANASEGTLTITSGPNSAGGGFIPQLFLTVRALAISIKTSPTSTALVNVSVSTADPVVSVTSQLNSSIQPIRIIGLVEDRLTTLALTFEQQPDRAALLAIDSIVLTISDNNTAPFVAPSPPASTALPTVTPSIVAPSPSRPPSQSRAQKSGDIAAEVLGALLGTFLVAVGAVVVILFYKKRRKPLAPAEPEPAAEHQDAPPDP